MCVVRQLTTLLPALSSQSLSVSRFLAPTCRAPPFGAVRTCVWPASTSQQYRQPARDTMPTLKDAAMTMAVAAGVAAVMAQSTEQTEYVRAGTHYDAVANCMVLCFRLPMVTRRVSQSALRLG